MDALASTDLNKIKVILLGASGVGKTTVVTKFIDRCFVESSVPTIGIDFTGKTICVDGRAVRMQIWDTAGQERFHSLIPSYIREARGAIVMYDVTDKESFYEVRRWIDEVNKKAENDVAIVICGNKQDKEKREVSTLEGEELAKELEVSFCETSAKSGHNINLLFEIIARESCSIPCAETPIHESVVLETITTEYKGKKASFCHPCRPN